MTTLDIINSERPLTPGEKLTYHCHVCSSDAEWAWPTASREPVPYCTHHLNAAKHTLQVALGMASAQ